MNRENKSSFFQLLVIFTFLPKSTPSFLIDAYVTVTYYNETSNYTTTETCECGVYGLASPVAKAVGVVGIPKNNNYQACDYNTEFTNTKKPWIALIERGNCTFSEKIQTAVRRNADAVVIYNAPETGNQTIQMANFALSPHAPGSRGAEAVWTAYLNVSWRVPHTGVNRTVWELSEEGVYGQDSPLEPVAGVLVPPDGPGALNACNPHTNFTVPTVWGSTVQVSWLALIQRGGGCTFADKIHLAYERGASGAVIFNFPGTRNEVIPMSHPGAGDIVAIMIGNLKGTKILQSIQRGIQVTMVIEVGKKHGPWVNHYSIFFVSVSFFIITAATVGYFIFYSARRLRNARAQSRKQRQLKADAKKAIGRLQLRTLKQGDKEIGPDGDSCAVCIELYKPNDLVRILTCNHIFHKTCVDPWLLEHRTCPMCKCDILKALGIEVDVEDGSVSLQVPVSSDASNSASAHEEDNRSETASSGYASVQGADEPPLEEHMQSANENLQLVNHEANSLAVDVVPHVDNPTFEEDETPAQETAAQEIKS
ncbi:E3 ubiquitin-protein ligase RNF128 [Fukomys damarensis]|uniref:E3 ubiquitin-protein ligase RNF128 n=1 Tax=Fukomys damarensis TaxID=885580 RepID=A0A091D8W0_FUKDA|nr:E3 ubiquitin-protein ligase RNF128 [Fukomys damarensis]